MSDAIRCPYLLGATGTRLSSLDSTAVLRVVLCYTVGVDFITLASNPNERLDTTYVTWHLPCVTSIQRSGIQLTGEGTSNVLLPLQLGDDIFWEQKRETRKTKEKMLKIRLSFGSRREPYPGFNQGLQRVTCAVKRKLTLCIRPNAYVRFTKDDPYSNQNTLELKMALKARYTVKHYRGACMYATIDNPT